jgi:hypothetical protein
MDIIYILLAICNKYILRFSKSLKNIRFLEQMNSKVAKRANMTKDFFCKKSTCLSEEAGFYADSKFIEME